jgi:hypothetical protein
MEVRGVGAQLPERKQSGRRYQSSFDRAYVESCELVAGLDGTKKQHSVPLEAAVIDLGNIQSASLNNNPQFQALKTVMTDLARSIIGSRDGSKIKMYLALGKLMQEVIQTSDHALQLDYLQRVHDWSERQGSPKRMIRHFRVSSQQIPSPEQRLGTTARVGDISNSQLYQAKMRSYHPEHSPPKEWLKYFTHRVINQTEDIDTQPSTAEHEAGISDRRPKQHPKVMPH